MVILRPPLLPLGLLLCLWLLCSPASCTNPTAKCKPICSVTNKRPSYIDIYPRGYESNKLYTVSLIVEPNITSVILEARDQNNSVIGSWQNPSQSCEGRAEYNLKGQIRTLFEAKWMSPKSMNISSVMIYIYCTTFLRHAELAVLILSRKPTTTHHKHTTKNSANRAFLSPVREAIQILLIFLTSTLLF
ncbi:hypothetical protein G4228_000450 [Cervus hanglu yarkandensis]|nr:hypothetical protein G4228_000450 [Cervus hanglu yarkandensis]